jgi:hypothetical protein
MLFCAGIGAVARADEEDEAGPLIEELFQTESVYPQEEGEVQVTVTTAYRNGRGADVFAVPLTFEYGITDSFQVEVEWDAFVHFDPDEERSRWSRETFLQILPGGEEEDDGGPTQSTSGIGDLGIGLKYSWMAIAGSGFHSAVGAEVVLPTGDDDRELGEGEVEFEAYGILAKDLPNLHNCQLFTQLGIEVGDDESLVFCNAGLIVPIGYARFTTEFNWSEEDVYITPGLIWDLPGTWECGVGVGVGLNNDSDHTRIIGQVSHEFGLFGDDD